MINRANQNILIWFVAFQLSACMMVDYAHTDSYVFENTSSDTAYLHLYRRGERIDIYTFSPNETKSLGDFTYDGKREVCPPFATRTPFEPQSDSAVQIMGTDTFGFFRSYDQNCEENNPLCRWNYFLNNAEDSYCEYIFKLKR